MMDETMITERQKRFFLNIRYYLRNDKKMLAFWETEIEEKIKETAIYALSGTVKFLHSELIQEYQNFGHSERWNKVRSLQKIILGIHRPRVENK
jgi:hypothetical protein